MTDVHLNLIFLVATPEALLLFSQLVLFPPG